jgi:lysophospholipase L1-like esterase
MENGLGEKSDIAFFKFCNVDINSKTDVKALFNEYSKALASLKAKYPNTVYVHMTSPVRIVQTGIKVPLKKLLGKPIDGYDDNAKREEYNELMRKAYAVKEPLFDLAMIESTLPDGSRTTFTKDGREYAYLAPEYTKDGGHLNEKGRKIVGEQLLIFLASLSR